MIEMIQRTATMNVPLRVRTKDQYNSHRTLFIKTCCTLSDTPSRISSWILLFLVLSLLGFLVSGNFFPSLISCNPFLTEKKKKTYISICINQIT